MWRMSQEIYNTRTILDKKELKSKLRVNSESNNLIFWFYYLWITIKEALMDIGYAARKQNVFED